MKRIIRLCIVGLLLVVLASCSLFRPVQKEPLAQTKDVAQQIGEALVSEDGDVSAVSIAIMHEGAIVEQGTHAQLLAQGGRYAALCAMQFASSPSELDK